MKHWLLCIVFVNSLLVFIECKHAKNATTTNVLNREAHKLYSPPIFFKEEPENIYVIESFSSSRQATSNSINKTSLVLDCSAQASQIKEANSLNLKWLKDNVELNFQQQPYSSDLEA
jgi:hypothetical protein